MTALLQHLVRVRSQAAEEMLAYLAELRQQMSANKLLERFGRKLDDLRVPLRVVAYEPISDFDTVRLRENLRLEDLGHDDDDDKAQRRVYAQRGTARDEEDEKEDKRARPQPEPLAQLEAQLRHAVLLGDPGSGKTEWLKYLVYRAAQEAYDQLNSFARVLDDIRFPAFLRLNDIAAHLRKTDELKDRLRKLGAIAAPDQVLKDAQRVAAAMLNALVAHHELSERLTPLVWQQWFTAPSTQHSALSTQHSALSTQHSLLCLDAWDEVRASDDEKKDLAQCLKRFANTAQPRIFLTSRIIGYSHEPLPVERAAKGDRRELQILPFEWKETEQFVTSFFADDQPRGQQMLADLRGKIAVAGMAQNPLLATLLCMAFSPNAKHKPLEFPARRVEVYARVLEGLLGEWEATDKGITAPKGLIAAKLRLLEELAYHFFPDEALSGELLHDFLWDATRGYMTRLNQAHPLLKITSPTILDELGKDGVLVPHGGADAEDFLFLHLTFQEYLTACALARRAKPENGGWARIKDFVNAKAWAPEWEEVITLMAGKLDDPVPLFDLLGDAEGDDFTRSRLCLLARCLPELSNINERELATLAEKTAMEVFDLWWEQQKQGDALPSLRRGLQATAQSQQEKVISLIQDRLHNGYYRGGKIGVHALGVIGASVSMEVVVFALFDEDQDAAEVLGRMGASAATEAVLRALVAALDNADGNVRARSARALGEMGASAATKTVLDALAVALRDEEIRVRFMSARALGEMGASAATKTVLDALAVALRDEAREVRLSAAEALRRMGMSAATEAVLRALVAALDDADGNVRARSARALGEMGASAATKTVRTALVQVALHDAEKLVCASAAAALECTEESKVTEIVRRVLAKGLLYASNKMRCTAARALGEMGASAATKIVLDALAVTLRDKAREVRLSAAEAIRQMGESAATKTVLRALVAVALRDEAREVRQNAAEALRRMRASAATEAVLQILEQVALHDEERDVRRRAAKVLVAMRNADAQQPQVLEEVVSAWSDSDFDFDWEGPTSSLHWLMRQGVRIHGNRDRIKVTTVHKLSRWDGMKP